LSRTLLKCTFEPHFGFSAILRVLKNIPYTSPDNQSPALRFIQTVIGRAIKKLPKVPLASSSFGITLFFTGDPPDKKWLLSRRSNPST
jgi:hypothetical protein